MPTLFALTSEWVALLATIEEFGGDFTHPEVVAAWDRLGSLSENTAEKLDGYYAVIRRCETDAAAAREEAERMTKIARVLEGAAERTKARVKAHLEATGQKAAKTATGRTFALQSNGGRRPVVLADAIDPAMLPASLVTIKRVPNVDAIRECLENSVTEECPDGMPLAFARLGKIGTHVRIR